MRTPRTLTGDPKRKKGRIKNVKKSTSASKSKSAKQPSSSGSGSSPVEQIGEAQATLARGLQEGSVAGQRQYEDACLEFAKTSQQIEIEAAERAVEAYEQYTKAAQKAAESENGQKQLEEAYQNYVATLQGLHEDTSRRWQEAYNELATKSAQAMEASQQQARRQYVEYLKSIQRVWASVDVESLIA